MTPSTVTDAPSSQGGVQPAGPRLRRDASENRQRIVAAAREVFAAQGLAAGLNEVARHAGVGVGTVYRRFPEKDALVGAVMGEQVAAMKRVADTALALDSAWEGLVHLMGTLAEMHAADRGFRDLMLAPEGTGDVARQVREHLAPRFEHLARRAHDEGTLRPDVSFTDIALSLVMVSDFAHRSATVRPSAYRRFLALLLEGMRERPDTTDLGEPVITSAETDEIVDSWLDPQAGRA